MRNYIIPVDTSYVARYKDYLYELEAHADTLTQLNEFGNSNFFILNETVTDNKQQNHDNYTFAELLKAGIISLVEWNDIVYTFLRVDLLKHHRGLINKYGTNTKVTVYPVVLSSFIAMTELVKDGPMAHFLEKYQLNFDDFLNNGKSVACFTSQIDIPNISSKYIWTINEGYIVINNVLEEGSIQVQAFYNTARHNVNNYIIVPSIGSASYYLPNPSLTYVDENTSSMHWEYIPEGTTSLGASVYFNLNTAPMRVICSGKSAVDGCSAQITSDAEKYTFTNWETEPSVFTMTSYKGTLWAGFNNNIATVQYIKLQNSIEQEIFVDDTIEYGNRIIDNYSKDYYTINVKNFKVDIATGSKSPYYVKLW